MVGSNSNRADLETIANWLHSGIIKYPIAKHYSVQELDDALHFKITHPGGGAVVVDVMDKWPTPVRLSTEPLVPPIEVPASTGEVGATKQDGDEVGVAQPAQDMSDANGAEVGYWHFCF
jgi:hypothetical protein